jgi:hypothetical protein
MEENRIAVQLSVTDSTNFDSFIQIEDALTLAFLGGASATVEGHDIGRGKFNIFLVAKGPLDSVVYRIKAVLDELGVLKHATIACRPPMQGGYSVVWPEEGGTFAL